jgi:tetratricopeptide (TPR) repeat protein
LWRCRATSRSATAWPSTRATPNVADLRPDIQQFYNTGRYRQAAEALEAEAQQRPQDGALKYWLGRCYFEMHEFNRAATVLEQAVSIDSSRSEYHDWFGKSLGRKAEQTSVFSPFSGLGLARRTHHEFETAVSLDAKNLEAQRDLIRYLLNAPGIAGGGEDHALDQINALSAVDPVEGDLARAEYFVTKRKADQAAQQYQKIVTEKPDRIGVYFEIAEYDRDKGDGEMMSEVVEAGAKLAPFDPRLQYYRAVAWILQKKDYDAAEKDLRTYLDAVPDSSESPAHSSAREWLGLLYEGEGKIDRAAEQYQTALTLDPKSKAARDGLRRLHK